MALEQIKDGQWTYFKLFISCPVCVDDGKNTPQSFWIHHNCISGGSIFIGDNAFYKCNKCPTESHVMNWHYGCPTHSTGDTLQFLKASSQTVAQAVSTAGQMVTETGNRWLIESLKNMGDFSIIPKDVEIYHFCSCNRYS